VLNCTTERRSQTGLPDKDCDSDQGTTNEFFSVVCKSAWKRLGDWNPQRTMRVIPLSYTLHQFTFTTMYWRQAHVQTARKRDGAWKESATWRSGQINSSVTAVLYACTSLSYVGFRINSITGNWGKFYH